MIPGKWILLVLAVPFVASAGFILFLAIGTLYYRWKDGHW